VRGNYGGGEMNTAKIYHDSDGDPRTILQMVTLEKEWAANRLQEGEKAIESIVEAMQDICKNADDTLWIGDCETIFERLWSIVQKFEGRERLEKLFPEYS
jgi:hypothetical protein